MQLFDARSKTAAIFGSGVFWCLEKKMIRSMTGFGRGEFLSSSRRITVEVKAVNHRYLDLSIKMPRQFNMFESEMRNVLKEYVSRGKVDVYVTCEEIEKAAASITLQHEVAEKYVSFAKELQERFGIENDLTVSRLLKMNDVVSDFDYEENKDELGSELMESFKSALENLRLARETEGRNLREDIVKKCEALKRNVDIIEDRYPEILEAYKERMLMKLNELKADTTLDESRLAAELTIYADKICVDEETVRLRSHIDAIVSTVDSKESVGRRLDFIAQELNREANTILSKSNDIITSDVAIELKTDIEKLREQIQNIE